MGKESIWKRLLKKIGIMKDNPKLLEENAKIFDIGETKNSFRSEISLRDINLKELLDKYTNADAKDVDEIKEDLRYALGINSNLKDFKDGKIMIDEVMDKLKNGQIFQIKKEDKLTSIQYKEVDGKISSFHITPDGITNNDNSYPGKEQIHQVKMVNGYMEKTDASVEKDENNVIRGINRRAETIVPGDKVVHSRSELKECTETGRPYRHEVETAKREEGNIVSINKEDKINPNLNKSGYMMKNPDERLTPLDSFEFGRDNDKIYKTKEEVPGYLAQENSKEEKQEGLELG